MIAAHAATDAATIRDFVRSLERFLGSHVDAARIDRAHAIPAEVLGGLGELGVFGVSLPIEHGGCGLGLPGATAVVEAVARVDRSVATTIGLHLGLGTRGLVAFGSDAQHAEFLPGLASGKTIAAFATTEPGAGSDLSRLATTATLEANGRLRVVGQKAFVTNGGLAGIYTLTTSSPGLGGAAGQSLVMLRREDGGVDIGREEEKLGLRGSSTTPIYVDTSVPLSRIVGEPGSGSRLLGHILAWGRTIMASGCAGTARAALDKTLAHVRNRQQFGKPLGQNAVVRAQVAHMAAELYTMRALIALTAADPSDLERRSLAAKVYASDADWRICDMALQLHGGSGYIEESGIPLLMRDARITRIFEGANDVLLGRLGLLELVAPRAVTAENSHGPTWRRVTEACQGLHARSGLAALRNAKALPHLGRLVMLREAADAVLHQTETAATCDPLDAALAAHALELLARAADAIALEPVDFHGTTPIAHLLLDGVDA